jgi:serine/threonine-protein phosphatase 2A regulatory subunit B
MAEPEKEESSRQEAAEENTKIEEKRAPSERVHSNWTLDWNFTQSFGERPAKYNPFDEDLITAVAFDRTGRFLSVGDKAGRIVVFEMMDFLTNQEHINAQVQNQHLPMSDGGSGSTSFRNRTKSFKNLDMAEPHENNMGAIIGSQNFVGTIPEYDYITEFQSHSKEFDYLKSVEIDKRISHMQWLHQNGRSLSLLAANEKTIKLWKINEKSMKKITRPAFFSMKEASLPELEEVSMQWTASLRGEFPKLHNYNINSMSLQKNDEIVITSDDLKMYLWNLESPEKTYQIVDLMPWSMDELSEVITSSDICQTEENIFLFSTSKGLIRVGDLRKAGVCDHTGITLKESSSDMFRKPQAEEDIFKDIVQSISDACFSHDGRFVYARDFLNVKIWDLAMPKKPVSVIPLFDPIKSKFSKLFEKDLIFDKFTIASSPCSNHILTGQYNNSFHIIDRTTLTNLRFDLMHTDNKGQMIKEIPLGYEEKLTNKFDLRSRVLKCAYHPTKNCIAMACINCLYFFVS